MAGRLKYVFRITYSEKGLGFDWLPNLSPQKKNRLRDIFDQIDKERKQSSEEQT